MLSLFAQKLFPCLFILSSTIHVLPVLSQCSDPDFIPCPPNDSSDLGGDDSSGGATPSLSSGIGEGFASPADSPPIDSSAMDAIDGDDDDDEGGSFKTKRQAGLCCSPAPVQCLVLDNDLPACYVSFFLIFHGAYLLYISYGSAS